MSLRDSVLKSEELGEADDEEVESGNVDEGREEFVDEVENDADGDFVNRDERDVDGESSFEFDSDDEG